jgi:hypothetical protein
LLSQWIQDFGVSRHSLLIHFEKSSSHEYQIYGKTESPEGGGVTFSQGKKVIIIPQMHIKRELEKPLALTTMLLDIKKKSSKKCEAIDIL